MHYQAMFIWVAADDSQRSEHKIFEGKNLVEAVEAAAEYGMAAKLRLVRIGEVGYH